MPHRGAAYLWRRFFLPSGLHLFANSIVESSICLWMISAPCFNSSVPCTDKWLFSEGLPSESVLICGSKSVLTSLITEYCTRSLLVTFEITTLYTNHFGVDCLLPNWQVFNNTMGGTCIFYTWKYLPSHWEGNCATMFTWVVAHQPLWCALCCVVC